MEAHETAVMDTVRSFKDRPGALLCVLHAIQDRLGCVSPESVAVIARELNLSRAEVHGVVTFYHHFRAHPAGRHVVRICRAEACQAMGAERLIAHAQASLGVKLKDTTADGLLTLEPVYCLGNCACSPAMLVDDDLHGRVSPEGFDAIVNSLRERP